MIGLIGRKLGMGQIFALTALLFPSRLSKLDPAPWYKKKPTERDGYTAIQLGFGTRKLQRATKPLIGHCKKANAAPLRCFASFVPDDIDQYEIGSAVTAIPFLSAGEIVDVIGKTKGRGFAGVMKRHGMSGFPGSVVERMSIFGMADRLVIVLFLGVSLKGNGWLDNMAMTRVTQLSSPGSRCSRRWSTCCLFAEQSLEHQVAVSSYAQSGGGKEITWKGNTQRIPVFSPERETVGEIELPADIAQQPAREHLLFEVVKMQRANRRAGTAATKTRAFVRGGGKKPWRQKGTGRARAGSSRSPIWVGGATIFGPHPRSYSYRLPKSARVTALKAALANKHREGALFIVNDIVLPEIKTKKMLEFLARLQLQQSAPVVIADANEQVEKAARNIPWAKVLRSEGLTSTICCIISRCSLPKRRFRK